MLDFFDSKEIKQHVGNCRNSGQTVPCCKGHEAQGTAARGGGRKKCGI